MGFSVDGDGIVQSALKQFFFLKENCFEETRENRENEGMTSISRT